MDTPTAIATLTALKSTIDSEIQGKQAQSDSLQVAIDQLNGILNTPLEDLRKAQLL